MIITNLMPLKFESITYSVICLEYNRYNVKVNGGYGQYCQMYGKVCIITKLIQRNKYCSIIIKIWYDEIISTKH